MTRIACIAVLACVIPTAALAQHEQHGQLGSVSFTTSCSSGVAADFNRAVALLHSFEFRPSMEAFNAVLKRDPSCAIAYWGVALCQWGNPFAGIKTGAPLERGRAAVDQGLSTGMPTRRERSYLMAAAELYKDTAAAPHRDRTIAYARAMDALQREFPEDVEARIFYALALNQTAAPNDKTYAAQLQAASILEPLWTKYPDHPGLPHYIIHAYDHPPLAAKALDAARRYAKIAPSAPHALHMPSHTFTRVGSWNESAESNVASERTALEQNLIGEALHAMDYQIYAYLQMAKDRSALAVVQRTPATGAKLDVNAIGGAAPGAAGVYATAAIPARYALERGDWTAAATLTASSSAFPQADAITHFARAVGAARRGTPAEARADLERLAALRDALAAAKDEYWREQVDIQRRVALAWVTYADGRRNEALALLRAAADSEDATDKSAVSPGPIAPARELLGEMLLDAGNSTEALAAFEAAMAKEPGRFRAAYGAARAAEASGDRAKARQLYERALSIAAAAEGTRPELQRARAFLKL